MATSKTNGTRNTSKSAAKTVAADKTDVVKKNVRRIKTPAPEVSPADAVFISRRVWPD